MSDRINILDIDIDNFTAKESMKRFVSSMQSEPISVIEMVTADSLMQMDEAPGLKTCVSYFDLVLAADTTILESADIADAKNLRETQERVFLKMLFRYINRHHKRVYLLVESESEGETLLNYLERYCKGAQIGGLAKVSALDRADDMIVNAINGECQCLARAWQDAPSPQRDAGCTEQIRPVRGKKAVPKRDGEKEEGDSRDYAGCKIRKPKNNKIIRNTFWSLCTLQI